MSLPGSLTPVPPSPLADLKDAVIHWVHFDNLAENHQKQAANARNKRSEFEEKILNYLDTTAFKGATLQITGGSLSRATRPKTTDLSWTFLETNLRDYYKTRGRTDETSAILEFIQSRREVKHIPYLKKT